MNEYDAHEYNAQIRQDTERERAEAARRDDVQRLAQERNEQRAPVAPPRPSVGRIVMYVAYGTPGGEFPAGVPRAAVITEVYDGGIPGVVETVGLCVMNPTGLFFNRTVPHDEHEKKPGTWHWPPRV